MIGLVGVGEGRWVWASGVHRKVGPLRAPTWGQTGEMPRANARASLLALTPLTGVRALSHPPQPTQRRDLALTSTCRRSWSARPPRDVAARARRSVACALRGTQVGVMSGTKAQQAREMMAWDDPARAEQRKPPGRTSARATWKDLDVAWRAGHRGKPGKAADCAMCCCQRGEQSQPRRRRGRRARSRSAAWRPRCAGGQRPCARTEGAVARAVVRGEQRDVSMTYQWRFVTYGMWDN